MLYESTIIEEIKEEIFGYCNYDDDHENDDPCKNCHTSLIYFGAGIFNLVLIFTPLTLISCLISPPISVMIAY